MGKPIEEEGFSIIQKKGFGASGKICNSKMMDGTLSSIKAKLSTSEEKAKARIDV